MKAAVIVFPGSNCDRDIAIALEQSMGRPRMVWHRTRNSQGRPGRRAGVSPTRLLRCGAMAAHSPIMRESSAPPKAAPFAGHLQWLPDHHRSWTLTGRADAQQGPQVRVQDVHLRVESSQSDFTRRYNAGTVVRIPIARRRQLLCGYKTLDQLEGED